MNIFTSKKKLLAEIDNLEEQIRIQSREMASLRKANTEFNRLWRDAVKENKLLKDETLATKEAMRAQGMEHAAALGQKNQDIELLNTQIREQQAAIAERDRTIAELQDSISGMASSVSELKSKLKAKAAKVAQLTNQLNELKAKDKHKTTKP